MSPYSKSFRPKSTQFRFVPSECNSYLLHFNRQTRLHNHTLRSFDCNPDFPIFRKLAIDILKSWSSNCFFFVTTNLKSSIKFPIKNFLQVAQLWKKTCFFGLTQKPNWLKVLRSFNFLSHIKNQTCFSP